MSIVQSRFNSLHYYVWLDATFLCGSTVGTGRFLAVRVGRDGTCGTKHETIKIPLCSHRPHVSVSLALFSIQFADCLVCLQELPTTLQCLFDPNTCDLEACGVDFNGNNEGFTYDQCPDGSGCPACVEPITTCFEECMPACLETTANDFVDCMVTPRCYLPCSQEWEGNIALGGGDSVSPMTSHGTECTQQEFMADPAGCIRSYFPSCDVVQTEAIDVVCEATSCCDTCHDEMIAHIDCFYNWLSGDSCSFNCPAAASGQNLRFLSSAVDTSSSRHQESAVQEAADAMLAATTSVLQRSGHRSLTSDDKARADKLREACQSVLVGDLIGNPGSSTNDYIKCVVKNTMDMVTDEENQQAAAATTTTGTVGQGQKTSGAFSFVNRSWLSLFSLVGVFLVV